MMFLIMSAAIQVCRAQMDWVLVDSSFLRGFSSYNEWEISKECSYFESGGTHDLYTCNQNQISYARLDKNNNRRMDKIFEKKSYRQQVIVDIFFDNAETPYDKAALFTLNLTKSSVSQNIMFQRYYSNGNLDQNARIICNSSSTQYFDFKTIVGTSPIGIEPDDKQILGILNLFVYVLYCQPTCKTCSSSTSCLTCYYGTIQIGGSCGCDPSHQFAQTGIGCRQECARDYFIARADNICVPDRRIKSNISYFESATFNTYSPFLFIQDSANIRNSPLLIHTCSSTSYVGSLLFNEEMSLQFGNSQSLKFIRLRITFYIKNFQTNNKIQILLDDQIQGEIIKAASQYTFVNVKKIQSSSTNCSTYDLIRIEAILRTFSDSSKLILKGAQLTQATSIWGFRNITIDSGYCQENCAICSDFSTCQQCNSGYFLFQNGCVSSCPAHSDDCVDYADMIPNSRYLAKGFYNLNMTTSDINKFYDLVITNGTNLMTGQKFSIFPTKFVLGGVVVWNNAIYQKSWSISKPHYAITIRFNLTYGDEYSGNFYYTIQGAKSIAHPKPNSSGQNFIGRNLKEITKYFEIYQNPFNSSSLNIDFECTDVVLNPKNQFCAISDYFIVVHYCLPFCQVCNNGVSCDTWESGHTNQNCDTNQYLYFDSLSETYSCISCNQPGCLACKNLEECISCDSSSQYNTLINGVCLSINPSPSISSIQCHKYCETCTGVLKTNCQTCVTDLHRTLSNNECLCKPGFYDDGYNLICLPICGDLLIVNGEDCDDGNYNPYDGCHNCKFSCDNACKECIFGICFDCQQGFQIIQNNCVAVCGDNLLVKIEECEDSNSNSNDGCYNCKFQCSNHCIDCQFNKCIKCDESDGWYLQDQTCQTICGDGIIAMQFEQCDEKNLHDNLFNQRFCFQCLYQCQDSCSNCYNGLCYQCKTGWILNPIENYCYPIDGDKLVVGNEQCDDGNNIQNDGCFLSQFQYQISCQQGLYGICQKCRSGFELINNICIEKNLDGLLVGVEQCDDQNLIGIDGCFQNMFDCTQFCIHCVLGQCLQCDQTSGYTQIDIFNNKCQTFCGDGIKSIDEDCDDRNEIPYDGCFECKFQCQVVCTDCRFGICYACGGDGWYLNNNYCECRGDGWHLIDHHCKTICGDGIVVHDLEECDDGNNIQYDGCHQCQFQCSEMCILCQQGICYDCDNYGWVIDNHNCKPFCGDGIIIGSEQCDDMNENQNDGCHQCQYACDEYCIDCQQGICEKCEFGRNLIQNVCSSQCGDGAYVKSVELCDDGNYENEDGCDKNCKIEANYLCLNREDQFSLCAYSKQPQFNIKLLSIQAGNCQNVQITFNQKMKYYGGEDQNKMSSLILISIIDMQDSQYDIVQQLIKQEPREYISDITILVEVKFYVSIERPYLKIEFKNDSFVSEYNLPLLQLTKTVQLFKPSVLSETQIIIAQNTVAYNQAVIYFLISLSSLCIITGSSEVFWNLMDQLQYLSYIKYVNIRFPENLNIYFEVFKLISIEPVIQALGIDNLLNLILQFQNNQILTDHKFVIDDINIRFLDNFKSFIFFLGSAYLGYYFFKITYLFLYQLQPYLLPKMNLIISKGFYFLRKKCYKSCEDFYYNGILRIIMSNAYDISFAMTIQLAYFQNNNISESINSYLSLIVFVSYLGISIYIFDILQKFFRLNTLKVKKQYESLFEGIQDQKNFWNTQYNAILLIKKFAFISIIVFMQKEGKLQTLLIATNQTLFLFYLIVNKPLQSHYEYCKILITESIVIFNTITFILYDYFTDVGLTQDSNINLGWLHISSFSAILTFSLIIDIFQQMKTRLIKLRQFCCRTMKQENQGESGALFI